MKRTSSIRMAAAALIAVLACAAPAAFAGETPAALTGASPAAAAFEKLKTLAGNWETKSPEGDMVTVSYRVVSGGSTVMEEMSHGSMISMYHLDGDRLMMTHYCEAKNQPRMHTAPIKSDSNSLKFSFVDITNLAKPSDPHMRGLELTFKDADHFTAAWSYSEGGKEVPAVFNYERKKG